MSSLYRNDRPLQCSLPFDEPYLRFVVHEHLASSHHYDLRIECGSRLMDFAIPKGPSTDPSIRRLAIRCPDHPKSCLWLEMFLLLQWDLGLIKPRCPPGMSHEEAILIGLERGELRFTLDGHKLKGAWVLRRSGKNWLLIKQEDEFASKKDVRRLNGSVKSGMTLREQLVLCMAYLILKCRTMKPRHDREGSWGRDLLLDAGSGHVRALTDQR